ncbi:hypothetical protein DPMN_042007 [Dreissena polymorpha]|uniref:Uncharacterized protein n=1 Tax=Dreissena polymorpha TaxID=45954 RepID=A0A9D4HUD8_DREPO|nr:hypothetical protein DPMN_042007 [Dreissena polymorpha]
MHEKIGSTPKTQQAEHVEVDGSPASDWDSDPGVDVTAAIAGTDTEDEDSDVYDPHYVTATDRVAEPCCSGATRSENHENDFGDIAAGRIYRKRTQPDPVRAPVKKIKLVESCVESKGRSDAPKEAAKVDEPAKEPGHVLSTDDECVIFGRHVACELQNLKHARYRRLAKLKIQEILFEIQEKCDPE